MDPDSIFYRFHPESIGWLHRRHEHGDEITEADLKRIFEADPAAWLDPLMQDYVKRALTEKLPRKKGRKPMSAAQRLRIFMAAFDIDERTAEIREERRSGKVKRLRGDLEPCVQAADDVGPQWGLPGGRSLLNQISALKKDPLFSE